MDAIPQPRVLDPDRVLTDDRTDFTAEEHRARALELDAALHESCDYARQLWSRLDEVRAYLLAILPPVTDADRGAAPTGAHDDQGWSDWIDAFAAVTSVLTGPHGDSGYGSSEGEREAHLRRGHAG